MTTTANDRDSNNDNDNVSNEDSSNNIHNNNYNNYDHYNNDDNYHVRKITIMIKLFSLLTTTSYRYLLTTFLTRIWSISCDSYN